MPRPTGLLWQTRDHQFVETALVLEANGQRRQLMIARSISVTAMNRNALSYEPTRRSWLPVVEAGSSQRRLNFASTRGIKKSPSEIFALFQRLHLPVGALLVSGSRRRRFMRRLRGGPSGEAKLVCSGRLDQTAPAQSGGHAQADEVQSCDRVLSGARPQTRPRDVDGGGAAQRRVADLRDYALVGGAHAANRQSWGAPELPTEHLRNMAVSAMCQFTRPFGSCSRRTSPNWQGGSLILLRSLRRALRMKLPRTGLLFSASYRL
jgi:hypothetical protein